MFLSLSFEDIHMDLVITGNQWHSTEGWVVLYVRVSDMRQMYKMKVFFGLIFDASRVIFLNFFNVVKEVVEASAR